VETTVEHRREVAIQQLVAVQEERPLTAQILTSQYIAEQAREELVDKIRELVFRGDIEHAVKLAHVLDLEVTRPDVDYAIRMRYVRDSDLEKMIDDRDLVTLVENVEKPILKVEEEIQDYYLGQTKLERLGLKDLI